MRSMSPRLGAVLLLSAASLSQNVTVPATLAGVEGGGSSSIPFGTSLACRYQCIYEAEELPWTGPRVLTGVLLRADNNTLNSVIPAKGFLDISVLVSTTDKNAVTASANFEENRGVDAVWVINNQQTLLPMQPALATAPRPANIPFIFSSPWAYGLTPATSSMPAPRNLLIEIWIHAQPAGVYRVDNMSSCVAQTTQFGLVDPICAEVGGVPVTLTGDASMQAGFSYGWQLANGGPSMPFMLMLDVTMAPGLLGNPAWALPYPMFDPQNPSLPSAAFTALGYSAPGCYFNVNPAALLPGSLDATGVAVVTAQLPAGREFVGETFYAQALVFSLTANPLHFIASRGYSSTICGPLGVTRIHAFYNSTQAPPTAGQVQPGVGLIFDVM